MKKFLVLLFALILPDLANADSVILMIGDGMGTNHLKCAGQAKPIYIPTLPVKGTVHTRSADSDVTDSAASATAYSCGQKTNRYFLGKLPNGEDCFTIAEEAIQKGLPVGIYSNDYWAGATPSAFYAHTTDRQDHEKIEKDKQAAAENMDIAVPVDNIADEVSARLNFLSEKSAGKGFFSMFEEFGVDSYSHGNNLENMKDSLYVFDHAVMNAADFVYKNPDATMIVLADHETGGLTDECQFTTGDHTGADISVFAYGKHAEMFAGEQDNTEIYQKMHQILFGNQ